MLNNVKKISRNLEFNRHVSTPVAETAPALTIPLAITPILASIYPPQQFGGFAVFIAMASSLSMVAQRLERV